MLTVLLATRNRARILGDVLEAYCHLQEPSSGWKLVIVDNGSTDQTAKVLASFANRLPLYTVREPKLGKNNALNTGLALVEGDLIVFTDDDVFPCTDWLVHLRKAADTQPAYSIFGGLVVPRWQVPPPAWIGWVELGPVFAIHPPSILGGEILRESLSMLYGANMAIRTNIFRSGECFDPRIGPRGGSYPMGSESSLVMRLSAQGHKALFLKELVVEHLIEKEHLTKDWVLERAIRCGRGRRRLAPNVKSWLGNPLHLLRDIPKEVLLIAAAWISFRREALFRARWRFNILRGKAVESFIMARERRLATRSASSTVNFKVTETSDSRFR
jgi:L-malate glycosyltransferase